MEVHLLIIACFWLAWANGANDNFIGVATLYGSRTCTYRTALIWATLATGAGSLVSISFAHLLVLRFSGAGLVGEELVTLPFLVAVAGGAAITKLLATALGMPVSTTHALTGGLLGAGLVANPLAVNWREFAGGFIQPLLLSPLLAIGLTVLVYTVLTRLRRRLRVHEQTCLCVGNAAPQPVTVLGDGRLLLRQGASAGLAVRVDSTQECVTRYGGDVFGVNAQAIVDTMHYLSAGAVCFARAVSDTPKIAALLLVEGAAGVPLEAPAKLALVAFAMLLGGWMFAHRVAETMSKKITGLNCGQGLTANLITAALVLGASRFGLPVSTTHVACSAIFGIGLVNGERRWHTVAAIALAWLFTLPLGLALGALCYWVIT